jgi:hypothetical protein
MAAAARIPKIARNLSWRDFARSDPPRVARLCVVGIARNDEFGAAVESKIGATSRARDCQNQPKRGPNGPRRIGGLMKVQSMIREPASYGNNCYQ